MKKVLGDYLRTVSQNTQIAQHPQGADTKSTAIAQKQAHPPKLHPIYLPKQHSTQSLIVNYQLSIINFQECFTTSSSIPQTSPTAAAN